MIVTILWLGFLTPSLRASDGVTALVGGTLIDGFGGMPTQNSVILIEGERVAAVGRLGELSIPKGATVVSTEGMSVLPGLWDMHVHLMINGHSDYDYWPAVLMGVADEVGTITEGNFADIIAVRGDVLRYVNLLQHVDIVIKHGVRYK